MINIIKLLFPVVPPTYNTKHPNLIYADSLVVSSGAVTKIPALYHEASPYYKKLVVCFHPNALDAGSSIGMFEQVLRKNGSNILVAEYPKYGVYTRGELSEEQIMYDAVALYDYSINKLHYKPSNIIVMGYSIGTNPAAYLASRRTIRLLVLIAPFTSAQEIAKSKASFLGYLVTNNFNTKQYLNNISNPVLIFHGRQDKIIPPSHGEKMFQILRQAGKVVEFKLLEECNHGNIIDFIELPQIITAFESKYTPPENHKFGSDLNTLRHKRKI